MTIFLIIGFIVTVLIASMYFRGRNTKYKIILFLTTAIMIFLAGMLFTYLGIVQKWYIELFAPPVLTFISVFISLFICPFTVKEAYENSPYKDLVSQEEWKFYTELEMLKRGKKLDDFMIDEQLLSPENYYKKQEDQTNKIWEEGKKMALDMIEEDRRDGVEIDIKELVNHKDEFIKIKVMNLFNNAREEDFIFSKGRKIAITEDALDGGCQGVITDQYDEIICPVWIKGEELNKVREFLK